MTLQQLYYVITISDTGSMNKAAEVINDVAPMKSEIGLLYLSDFNRQIIMKLLQANHLEFHHLSDCGVYVYLSDGEVLYVHMNMADTLHYLHTENGYILSTRPLNDGAWTPFPLTQLMAFQGGELLFTGTKHGNVFTSVMQRVSVYEAMHI